MTRTPSEPEAASTDTTTTTETTSSTTTPTTIQSSAPKDALVRDVRRILESNEEIALITNREEPFYARRIQTELSREYNWDVTTDLVEAAVDEIGMRVVKRCVRMHLED